MRTHQDDPMSTQLLRAARRAANHAYAPYSSFRVGAAVLCADGSIISGCNVENASYSLSICAERTALFSAVASGKRDFLALALACIDGETRSPESFMPCGACLQVMNELLVEVAEIFIDDVGSFNLSELLPRPFLLP